MEDKTLTADQFRTWLDDTPPDTLIDTNDIYACAGALAVIHAFPDCESGQYSGTCWGVTDGYVSFDGEAVEISSERVVGNTIYALPSGWVTAAQVRAEFERQVTRAG